MKTTQRIAARRSLSLLAVAVLGLAGCSAETTGSASGMPRIGVFIPANSNAYLRAEEAAAKKYGAELGLDVTVVTSNWETQAQNTAFGFAQQRKSYDGWVVNAISPVDQCGTLKQAASKGVPIVIAITAICGDDGYTVGTVGFVGEQNRVGYNAWFDYMFRTSKPGPVSILTGPPLDFVTNTTTAVAKDRFASQKGFRLASLQNTDYSTDAAFKATQTFLKANPNLVAVASNYSGMTRGVVQAVRQAARKGSVAVFDSNGDKWTKQQIKAGAITAALPGMPTSDIKLSLQLIKEKLEGQKVSRVTNPLDSLKFKGAPIITKDNVAQWKPEN
ncbi:sugar ABC transporter substrate-binding protein [Streptomyces aureus]|uniref:Sugar ABC transporter substrate-binding protein n=1 Tax=Streptomyces aureus TaxID=193461 RepID=A0ABV4SYM0_9ACTN